MDLDTRARQASHSLREVVGTATSSDDVVVTLRPRLPRRPVAVAAALALVAGGLAVFATTSGNDPDAQSVVAGEGEGAAGLVPLMVADPVPEGFRREIAVEYSEPAASIRYGLFGDPDADRPFAGGDLGVLVNGVDPGDAGDAVSPPELDVSAIVATDRNGRSLAWTTDDGRRVEVTSFSLSDEELLVAARALDPADPTGTPTGALPDGLRPVVVSSMSGMGALTSYGSGGSRLEIMAYRNEPGMMTWLEWQAGLAATGVEIDGRPGLVFPGERDASAPCDDATGQCNLVGNGLAWVESDDVVVELRSWELSVDDLLALAEGVRPATPVEREAARADALRPFGDGEPVVEGITGGVGWKLTVEPFDDAPSAREVCIVAVESASESDSVAASAGWASCKATEVPDFDRRPYLDEPSVTPVFENGTANVVWGRVDSEVASVRISVAGELDVEVPTHTVVGAEGRFYAADLGTSSGELTITALGGLASVSQTVSPPNPTPESGE